MMMTYSSIAHDNNGDDGDDDQITAIGELVTLPLVVLVSFMAQPRLLFAMAKDGLLPHLFAEVDSRGTLLKGSLVRRQGGTCCRG